MRVLIESVDWGCWLRVLIESVGWGCWSTEGVAHHIVDAECLTHGRGRSKLVDGGCWLRVLVEGVGRGRVLVWRVLIEGVGKTLSISTLFNTPPSHPITHLFSTAFSTAFSTPSTNTLNQHPLFFFQRRQSTHSSQTPSLITSPCNLDTGSPLSVFGGKY